MGFLGDTRRTKVKKSFQAGCVDSGLSTLRKDVGLGPQGLRPQK